MDTSYHCRELKYKYYIIQIIIFFIQIISSPPQHHLDFHSFCFVLPFGGIAWLLTLDFPLCTHSSTALSKLNYVF